MKYYSYSIVIPVYNAEKYIEEMIQSVINQTYSNWNLILIDDGSTDKSGQICDRYKNDHIFVFHNKNMGQVAARIDGIQRADGDYTLVLDADDSINPHYLERANEILNNYEYDVVMFPYELCDDHLNPSGQLSSIPDRVGRMDRDEVLHWIIKTYSHGLVDKVIKTSLIKKGVAGVPTRKLKVNGDYVLIVPIICQINSAYFDEQPMYYYRVLSSSTSHAYCFQHLLDTDFVSENVESFLQQTEIYNDDFRKNINLAFLHMIVWMIEGIIESKNYHFNEIKSFKALGFYKRSFEFEKREFFSKYELRILKLLRNQTFLLFPFVKSVSALKKIKHIIVS